MTKKENFATLIDIVNTSDYAEKTDMVDFLNHEIELLSRPKTASSSETKTQKENKGVKEAILNALSECESPVTVSELQAAHPEIGDFSNQKVSALLRQMVADGTVVKTTDKRKSYFAVA